MKVRVFTLQLDRGTGAFDDSELQAFLAERDALAVYEHLLEHEDVPRLVLVVTYKEGAPLRGSRPTPSAVNAPPLDVPAEARGLYEALRRWRNERARTDGRPTYILFTNAQLLAIAQARPTTRAALGEVPGVGEARIHDYADELLAIIKGVVDANG